MFKKKIVLHYIIYIFCIIFLGLRHISLGFFFVRVSIIRAVTGLMEKYH
jgi:hypothetical protein